ncbi:NUDIX hydrolase [Lewinella sp. IMCC34183]|uniref:NUDIX hydrolase n=1 Tax=Lewinella sp. IMCC34183 TaxID=2248762 RepID=UPI0013007488|nr:NUDIX domain-containing protein [Lewinella sp. IMCC34183]
MYVIYINDRPLVLREAGTPGPYGDTAPDTHLVARYSGKRKSLLNYADTLEKGSQKVSSVELLTDDLAGLWDDFQSHYKWVEAAGGLVTHTGHGKQLFIFRRGYWDLPKGKLDAGEDRAAAALREVREETGLEDVTLGERLPTTFHTYRTKKHRILKPTYWFRMTTAQDDLVPETGEGIERAEWRTVASVLAADDPLYENLRALLLRA